MDALRFLRAAPRRFAALSRLQRQQGADGRDRGSSFLTARFSLPSRRSESGDVRKNILRRTRGVLRDAAVLRRRFWSPSHCKERGKGRGGGDERILHFIYRALQLLMELGGGGKVLQREQCDSADKRWSENGIFASIPMQLNRELPGRNISRLFSLCELSLLSSVLQNRALQTNPVDQEARSQTLSKGREGIKALAAPTQSRDLAGYWTP